MKKILAILLFALLLTGCTVSPVHQQAAPSVDLGSLLLTLDDLPPGWAVEPVEPDDLTEAESQFLCLTVPARAVEKVQAEFSQGMLGPFLWLSAVRYAPEDVSTKMEETRETLAECRTWQVEENGEVTEVTVIPISFPVVGDDSVAMRVTISVFQINAFYIRLGDVVLTIQHGGLGGVDMADSEAFVQLATDKATQALP